jgi:hypothetical protein
MRVTRARLLKSLCRIFDRVLSRGTPVERPRRLERLTPHPGTIVGDPEDLVEIDWTREWKPSGTR